MQKVSHNLTVKELVVGQPDSDQYRRSEYTDLKQQSLASLLDLHIKICQKIFMKNHSRVYVAHPTYLYFELHSGYGYDPETGHPGSPIVFLQAANALSLDYHAYFCERDDETRHTLEAHIAKYNQRSHGATIDFWGDHNALLTTFPQEPQRNRYGVVYADPSNAVIPLELLQTFNKAYPKVDIALNLACTSHKRASRATGAPHLSEELKAIGKKYWIVSEGVGNFQWSILFGTNWDRYPDFTSRDKQGLYFRKWYRSTSKQGKLILDKLSKTKKELDEDHGEQLTLF